jgi:hypothetical protein
MFALLYPVTDDVKKENAREMVGWGKKEQDTITLSSVKHSTD